MSIRPWHAAPRCGLAPCTGPLVPFGTDDPALAADPLHVRCAACGDDFLLDPTDPNDLRRLARVWWSAGAWIGRNDERSP